MAQNGRKSLLHILRGLTCLSGFCLLLLTLSLSSCTTSLADEIASDQFLPFLQNSENDEPDQLIPFHYEVVDDDGPVGIWQKSAGDINGDGLVDIIAGGNGEGGLVWYESPAWNKHTIAAGGGHSTDGEVGDINHDGNADYVSLTTTEILWYENPDWTVHLIDDRVLHDLELSDFDGDNDLDIVARDQGEFGHSGDELHFYRQDSPLEWTHRAVSIPNGEGLTVADINGDGADDIVVNGRWYQNSGDIIDGDWDEHIYTSSWTHPNAYVAVGDLNNDLRPDIALSPSELEEQTYKISWFEAPEDPEASDWTEHIVEDDVETVYHFVGIADLDNDGNADIATAEMAQGGDPDEVKVYINDGGGLSWTKQVLAESGSHSMRLADIDNDNDIDLFGANWQGSSVELWNNQTCQSHLGAWHRHVIDAEKPWGTVFISGADLNDDQLPDIITGGWWYQNPGSPGAVWTRQTIGSPLNNMAVVFDVDNDGDLDVLGTEGQGSDANSSFVWAQNDGAGTFTILDNIETAEGDFLQGAAANNFHNLTSQEVMLSWHVGGMGIQKLSLPDNPVADVWTWEKISETSQDEDLSAGDIDNDGDLDLLLGTKWLRNDGSGWTEFTLFNTNESPDRNELFDMNGDNKLDAVIGYEAISEQGVLAWYAQGSESTSEWAEHVISDTIIGPMSLDVADIDLDGDPDVIAGEHNLTDPASAKLFVFENLDGMGTSWASHLIHQGDEHHDGAQVIDIDLDGDLDVISIGWGHNQVLLYENKTAECAPGN